MEGRKLEIEDLPEEAGKALEYNVPPFTVTDSCSMTSFYGETLCCWAWARTALAPLQSTDCLSCFRYLPS